MKPKEYKQKSMKEKEKTKEDYEIQKARREVYEENIKKLEKIAPQIIYQFKMMKQRKSSQAYILAEN